jgi:hypothetical protein
MADRKERAVNQSVHQLLRLILEGFAWFLRTIEALWDWSWAQIVSAFSLPWDNLPAWKIAVGVIAMAILVGLLAVMFRRALAAFGRIAAAFWTMAVTVFGVLVFVVVAGLFSRGFQWVVAASRITSGTGSCSRFANVAASRVASAPAGVLTKSSTGRLPGPRPKYGDFDENEFHDLSHRCAGVDGGDLRHFAELGRGSRPDPGRAGRARSAGSA